MLPCDLGIVHKILAGGGISTGVQPGAQVDELAALRTQRKEPGLPWIALFGKFHDSFADRASELPLRL
jgi:hypothetical protein